MTLPRDILTGKLPAVYNTILSLGGVLVPMQQDLDGNVQAYYPDGSTLACTPTPGVAFSCDGQLPRVAGGSPVATFDEDTDKVTGPVAAGDKLQFSNGGTLLVLVSPAASDTNSIAIQKGAPTIYTRQGYVIYTSPARGIVFQTSASASTYTAIGILSDAYAPGEWFLVAATLDLDGNAKLYKNGVLIASGESMDLPDDADGQLAIGNANAGTPERFVGPVAFAAVIDEVLDADALKGLSAQCGPE